MPAEEVVIKVRDDGPYKVMGPVRLIDAQGGEIAVPEGAFALCRCGGSRSMPFCDRTHRERGFASQVRCGSAESDA